MSEGYEVPLGYRGDRRINSISSINSIIMPERDDDGKDKVKERIAQIKRLSACMRPPEQPNAASGRCWSVSYFAFVSFFVSLEMMSYINWSMVMQRKHPPVIGIAFRTNAGGLSAINIAIRYAIA